MFGYQKIQNRLDELKEVLAPTAGTTLGLIERYTKLEQELGITGLSDFLNAPPSAFTGWQSNGRNHVLPDGIYDLRHRLIPAWGDICRRLQVMTTPDTAYLALVVRWPDWQSKEWSIKGLDVGSDHGCSAEAVLVLASDYRERQDLKPKGWMFERLRGSFQYDGGYGVFVSVMTPNDAFKRFRKNYNVPSWCDNALIKPDSILGLTDKPTPRDRELLDQIIRAYWKHLRDAYGYQAKHETDGPLQNPLVDDIPKVLALPDRVSDANLPREVALMDDWGASGLLENWHVASKVARIIQKHHDRVAPIKLELPTPSFGLHICKK